MTSLPSLRISGIGMLSSAGWGVGSMLDAIAQGKLSPRTKRHDGPTTLACWESPLQPPFAVKAALGSRGTREMDRLTGMTVACAADALQQSEIGGRCAADQIGMVFGTTMGSGRSIVDFGADIFTQSVPYFVDVARFPSITLNAAAGATAIWHNLRGPNATVCGGHLAGLHALRYAQRCLGLGYASALLVSASEELHELRQLATADGDEVHLGEASVAFVVEPHEAAVMGAQLGCLLGTTALFVHGQDCMQTALSRAVRVLLERCGRQSADVAFVSGSRPSQSRRAALERAALREALDARDATVLPSAADFLGDTGAASFSVQVAIALHALARLPQHACALVVGTSSSGQAGCALLANSAPRTDGNAQCRLQAAQENGT